MNKNIISYILLFFLSLSVQAQSWLGKGTQNEPYIIQNATQLAELATAVNNGTNSYLNKYFELTNDIELNGNWLPIGTNRTRSFQGNFDGKGHMIKNLTITTSSTDSIGLFGYVKYAMIQNIGIESGTINARNAVGGIVGSAYISFIINCYNKATVTGANSVGGIVGYAYSPSLNNCYNRGKISGNNAVGGILGKGDLIMDSDLNVYHAIKIGTQIWMRENLRTTKYNDNTTIPTKLINSLWMTAGINKTPAYCVYDNSVDPDYIDKYGMLYNGYAAKSPNLCPKGWRVPTNDEWNAMLSFLNESNNAGAKLKTKGFLDWNNQGISGTNTSKFTAYPSGFRYNSGDYEGNGSFSYWWTSSLYNSEQMWYHYLSYDSSDSGCLFNSLSFGFSVRCIKILD